MSESAVTCQCGAMLIVSDRNSVVVAMRVSDFYKAHAVCNERLVSAQPIPERAPTGQCSECDHPWEQHITGSGVLAGERHCKPGCDCERRP